MKPANSPGPNAEPYSVPGLNSVSRFRTTASSGSPKFSWIVNAAGEFEFAGSEAASFTGIEPVELRAGGLKRVVHRRDLPTAIRLFRHAVSTGDSLTFCIRLRRFDGRHFLFRVHADVRHDRDHRFAGLAGFAEQIPSPAAPDHSSHEAATSCAEMRPDQIQLMQEEIKRARARIELAVRGSKVGIWEGSLTEEDWLFADHIEILLGYEPGFLRHSRSFTRDLIHPDDREINRIMYDAHGSGAPNESEIRLRNREGEYRWFRIIGESSRNADGSLRWIGGTITDIDDIKRARLSAEEQVKQRDEFLAMLSHELRNPMTAIAYAADFAAMNDSLPADIREMMEIIERQTRQMTRLMDDLLDVTRVTRNRIVFEKSSHNFGSLLRDALECVKPSFDKRKQQLTVDLPLLPVQMYGDEARLKQALTNLLDNASKYTPAGGHIFVDSNLKNGILRIAVTDSGRGLPAEELPRIFELFYQPEPAIHRSDGGLGVGLYLVKYIIEAHNGSIDVHSDGPGEGCRFTITLPATGFPVENSRRPARKVSGKRVVIVEDNHDSRHALELALKNHGFEVAGFCDGETAEKAIRTLQPDVAIIDIGLPGRNGFELATEIRALGNSVPAFAQPMLIALTGYGQLDDRNRALESGFDMHMVKPANVELICSAISSGTRSGITLSDSTQRSECGTGAAKNETGTSKGRKVYVDPPGSPEPKKRAPQNGARIDN